MNPKLQQKLIQNQERRDFEELLHLLPLSLSKHIDRQLFAYSNSFFEKFPILPGDELADVKGERKKFFDRYIFHDFDAIEHVKEHLSDCPLELHFPLVCWFGRGPAIIFRQYLDLTLLVEVSKAFNLRVYASDINFNAGLIIDEYLGYLPADRATNSNELVYEVVFFRRTASTS